MKSRELAVIFLLVLCGMAFAQNESVITGTLLGHDGKPMLKAQMDLLARPDARRSLATATVDAQGNFKLRFTQTGMWYLSCTGVNHYQHVIALWLDQPAQEKVAVRLKPYEYVADFSEVKIAGDFNNFDFNSAELMARQSDGTFGFETEFDAAAFSYQLLGVEKTGRTINGTQSDDFVYDNGGDYLSLVNVENKKVKVVFNPAMLKPGQPGDEATVQFGNPQSFSARFYTVMQVQEKRRSQYSNVYQSYRAAHEGEAEDFKYDWKPALATLSHSIAHEKDAKLRQVLLVNYLEIGGMGAEASMGKKLVQQAVAEVPPTSPLWSSAPWILPRSSQWSGDRKGHENYLNQVLAQHPDRNLRAGILSWRLSEADAKGDTTKAQNIYNRLQTEFGDTQEAQFAKMMYDPNRAVKKGGKLPAFALAAMDQAGVMYNNDSMKGKIYLLDFWAVWCGPCIGEMPALHSSYEKFKGKNFEILSLSFDPKPEDVARFREKKWQMPWRHAFVERGFNSELARSFEVMGIPKPVLVDGNTNTILATENDLRGKKLEQTLARVLR